MDRNEKALELHRQWKGKIRVTTPCKLEDREDLSLAYTPGVAAPCLEIQKDVEKSYEYTRRGNLVAVVTDGTAVLGLGDIGPEAGMPVMEGKCALFQAFAGVDAFPLCVRSKDVDEIVHAVELIAGSFGGINLEDIAAPRCFEVERKLKEKLDIPVFHDDQHGTAVVTDGTAVLGLGDIGPEAGMPVMEGKCVLFKAFGDVNAVPLCIRSKDVDEIVHTVSLLAGSFGGINLEDISAPRCFEIERKLKEVCDIPIFHDDQHGTAIIVAAALINALKLVNKKIEDITAVFSGAGAAGTAIFKLLKSMGLGDAIICDRKGAICSARTDLNDEKKALLELSNKQDKSGSLADVMVGADLFIGVSSPGVVTPEMVKTMAPNPILFPMANPVPEIMPDLAREAGAAVIGTGRSDFPNQINNVLAFPGVFRGAFDVRASDINEEMKLAAARALAQLVSDEELTPDYIIPAPFDQRVCPAVAAAVAQAARDSGVARI